MIYFILIYLVIGIVMHVYQEEYDRENYPEIFNSMFIEDYIGYVLDNVLLWIFDLISYLRDTFNE